MELLEKLQEQQKDLIIRISGLSDLYLQYQAKEEYDLLSIQIEELKNQLISIQKENDAKAIENIIDNLEQERKDYYNDLFCKCSFIDAINKTNNLCIEKLCEKMRLRLPKDLDDKRVLTMMLNSLDYHLDLCDLESNCIDTIGRGKQKIKIFVENQNIYTYK